MTDAPKSCPTAADLIKAGLSKPYAYNIVGGHRTPSLKKALEIYDRIGAQLGALEGLSPEEIETARRMAA